MVKLTLTALALLAVTQGSFAATVCTSKPNQTGGTVSVTISENDEGQPTISLFVQRGMPHFISQSGPFVATVQHEQDETLYTFEDNFGQKNTVAFITSAIGGKLQTTASANFGIWKDATMICK